MHVQPTIQFWFYFVNQWICEDYEVKKHYADLRQKCQKSSPESKWKLDHREGQSKNLYNLLYILINSK